MKDALYKLDGEKMGLRKINQKPIEWSEEDKKRFHEFWRKYGSSIRLSGD